MSVNVGARTRSDPYRSWLTGELVLVGALTFALGTLAFNRRLGGFPHPEARLAVVTAIAVVATIVAILAAIRFLVEGRLLDALLAGAFMASALGAALFDVVPVLSGGEPSEWQSWAWVGIGLVATALIAIAPYTTRRLGFRRPVLAAVWGGVVLSLIGMFLIVRALDAGDTTVESTLAAENGLEIASAVKAALAVVATVGFGLRYRRDGRDLDSWLALALTLVVFADLQAVLAPDLGTRGLLQGDFLRLIANGVLLVGVWRAISDAEFGRAVADERARVAQDIHDGLAQYLFAISTHVTMLEGGAPLEKTLPKLKQAAVAAQHEARYAVLALSSAGGVAPFDAALRRYVEVLTADGALDVDVAIDPAVKLAPDEQIEVFRIVQEGLANARRHADARRAWVRIGWRAGRRIVLVRDDGVGFEGETVAAGQGLKSMQRRAEAIEGAFSLRSSPQRGTAIEIVLRAA
jgi:signal transduction histidine kinase